MIWFHLYKILENPNKFIVLKTAQVLPGARAIQKEGNKTDNTKHRRKFCVLYPLS